MIEFPNSAKDEHGRLLVAGGGILQIHLNAQKRTDAGAEGPSSLILLTVIVPA